MFEGQSDSAARTSDAASTRLRRLAVGAWRHSFRLIAALLVIAVIFTAARQASSPGSKSVPAPSVADAVVGEPPKVIDWPSQYAWLSKRGRSKYEPLSVRVAAPAGHSRTNVTAGSFADWLRHLPAAPSDRPVTNSRRQTVVPAGDASIAAVLDLQPAAGNLLTAPVILVRLRAEYLWAMNANDKLSFHYTSGHVSRWADWAAGERPTVHGKVVSFHKEGADDDSRANFCGYLETLFRYTTVYSLLQDAKPSAAGTIAAGDMFVQTGKRAGALMVLDVATDPQGRVKVLLGQGGNPAQTFHVLRADDGDPWFAVSQTKGVTLRGQTLRLKDLRSWPK